MERREQLGEEHLAFHCVMASAAPWLFPSDLEAELGRCSCAPQWGRAQGSPLRAQHHCSHWDHREPEPHVLHGSHLEIGMFSFPLRVGIWEGKEIKFHFLDYKSVFLNIVSFL